MKKEIMKILAITFIATLVLCALGFFMFKIMFGYDSFTNASGYGLSNKFGKINSLVPVNLINKSTDFKLFSLLTQLKFNFVKPPSEYTITGTDEGIISNLKPNKSKNIILFPGLTDIILKQNNSEVWPRNFNKIDNSKSASAFNNNEGHFNTIITVLTSLGYKNGVNLHTMVGDFRKIDMDSLYKLFLTFIQNNTVIIAYDYGCVLANICIQKLMSDNSENINLIEKYILIAPTLGGTVMTLRDYLSGNGIVPTSLIQDYHSIIMSLPCPEIYENYPIAIYNSIKYNASNLKSLLKEANKDTDLYENIHQLQLLSLQRININSIIVTSNQFSTPVCYNFRNNFNEEPERYRSINNNQKPGLDIQNNTTFEGIQDFGDKVVPFSVTQKVKESLFENCKLEIIKDKDHFTILKSYELALIILSNL